MRGGGGRVSPPRGPSWATSQKAKYTQTFHRTRFFYFFDVKFFCVFFPVVKGFSLRLLCLFSNSFRFKFFLYSLYIHVYMFYKFFHCTHNSSTICFCLCLQWFLFGILVLDGMSERSHCHIIIFSLHCFNGFYVASWRIMQHVIERPLPYN